MSASGLDFADLSQRYLAAQLAGDRDAALRVVVHDCLGRGASLQAVQHHVIRAAQCELGRLWQNNQVSIAEEHVATGISQIVMARIFEHAPYVAHNGKRVAVACVEGELHDMPARFVADYLDLAGFDVHYLGANVPGAQLIAHVRKLAPAALALSATMSFHAPALREAIYGLRRELGDALPILVGGHALEWASGLSEELNVHAGPTEPDAIVALVQKLVGA